MNGGDLARLQAGDELQPLEFPPVTRAMLALYAGAAWDHNPMHIDSDVARAAGMPDVYAHGMLLMAWMGRYLTGLAPQQRILDFGVRFQSITQVHARLTCSARVVAVDERADGRRIGLELRLCDQDGDSKVTGQATLVA
jgi:acyl dehydratase